MMALQTQATVVCSALGMFSKYPSQKIYWVGIGNI